MGSTIHQVNIQPTVLVIIQKGPSSTHGLDQIFLRSGAVFMAPIDARSLGHINKSNLPFSTGKDARNNQEAEVEIKASWTTQGHRISLFEPKGKETRWPKQQEYSRLHDCPGSVSGLRTGFSGLFRGALALPKPGESVLRKPHDPSRGGRVVSKSVGAGPRLTPRAPQLRTGLARVSSNRRRDSRSGKGATAGP